MNEEKIRVRFAPSPTGQLHLGNARTALFNYLYARKTGGTFVLRVEDTDLERSSAEAEEAILNDLRWMGLEWAEGPGRGGEYGPYRQSERREIYARYASELLEKGHAYRCYCTPEELEEKRKRSLARGVPPKYDGRCRNLKPEEEQAFAAEGRASSLRFKVETRRVDFEDLIKGRMSFEGQTLGDFIILRSDGTAAYNFAVVVDDALMQITHVIRGEDHLTNTPRQLLIYQALGWQPPKFAHPPMILGPDHSPLSKRHGATSVTYFREEGFLPEALVNYLALLGWSVDAGQEIMSLEELSQKFSLGRVSRSSAIFDIDKLQWVNRAHAPHPAGFRYRCGGSWRFVAAFRGGDVRGRGGQPQGSGGAPPPLPGREFRLGTRGPGSPGIGGDRQGPERLERRSGSGRGNHGGKLQTDYGGPGQAGGGDRTASLPAASRGPDRKDTRA